MNGVNTNRVVHSWNARDTIGYECPIKELVNRTTTQVIEERGERIYQAVLDIGIHVDKEELLKALQYDRGQYEKGFQDGRASAVKHGWWELTPHKESCNYRWNVTAHCSECKHDEGEIWAGFFPGIPDSIAESVSLNCAESVKLSNYCPNCGAKMDGGDQ